MTQSYSPKMTPTNQDRIAQMMSNENILLSDKLMKLQVENKEMFHKYHKLKKAFYELIETHEDYRKRNDLEFTDRYDWIERAGLLDDAE